MKLILHAKYYSKHWAFKRWVRQKPLLLSSRHSSRGDNKRGRKGREGEKEEQREAGRQEREKETKKGGN